MMEMVKCTTSIDKPFGVDQVTVCRTSDCTGTHAMTDGHTTIAAAKSIIKTIKSLCSTNFKIYDIIFCYIFLSNPLYYTILCSTILYDTTLYCAIPNHMT